MRKTFLFAIALLLAGPAVAAEQPRGLNTDKRVKVAVYDSNQVYVINGHYDFQTTIQFALNEQIQTLSVGDSVGWAVTALGSMVNVKPTSMHGSTNLTIITDERTYLFELREGHGDPEVEAVFLLKFTFPGLQDVNLNADRGYVRQVKDPVAAANGPQGEINLDYEARGESAIVPKRVFDDGQFTYMEFKRHQEIPGIFAVKPDQSEAIINFRRQDNYVIVEGVRGQFTLRQGTTTASIFNNGWGTN